MHLGFYLHKVLFIYMNTDMKIFQTTDAHCNVLVGFFYKQFYIYL